jgi:hypothetical protein
LVEAIAKQSQNIKWVTTVDNRKVGHKLIRRVSLDQFYALVTGQEDAFYQVCMVLPSIIEDVIHHTGDNLVPYDTVIDELKDIAQSVGIEHDDFALTLAIYLLGFRSYSGFDSCRS